ncbi:hypothetical protein DQ04_25961000, partial [Trypanosoma grayi]|uniref:hypothetical protein n=1 Tax=Trypanosoma grayi TaxID=71804 RepID=UPI0004F4A77F
ETLRRRARCSPKRDRRPLYIVPRCFGKVSGSMAVGEWLSSRRGMPPGIPYPQRFFIRNPYCSHAQWVRVRAANAGGPCRQHRREACPVCFRPTPGQTPTPLVNMRAADSGGNFVILWCG